MPAACPPRAVVRATRSPLNNVGAVDAHRRRAITIITLIVIRRGDIGAPYLPGSAGGLNGQTGPAGADGRRHPGAVQRRQYSLSGLLVCGACGRRIMGRTDRYRHVDACADFMAAAPAAHGGYGRSFGGRMRGESYPAAWYDGMVAAALRKVSASSVLMTTQSRRRWPRVRVRPMSSPSDESNAIARQRPLDSCAIETSRSCRPRWLGSTWRTAGEGSGIRACDRGASSPLSDQPVAALE